MEFCPKCGGLILVDDKKKAGCSKCSYKPKGRIKIQASEKVNKAVEVAVVDEKKSSTHPIVKIKCKSSKCKNDKCYFWTLQTRSSDESETKFYKCVKCDHTWREYR